LGLLRKGFFFQVTLDCDSERHYVLCGWLGLQRMPDLHGPLAGLLDRHFADGLLHQLALHAPMQNEGFRLGTAANVQSWKPVDTPYSALIRQHVNGFLVCSYDLCLSLAFGRRTNWYSHDAPPLARPADLNQSAVQAILRAILFLPKQPGRREYI